MMNIRWILHLELCDSEDGFKAWVYTWDGKWWLMERLADAWPNNPPSQQTLPPLSRQTSTVAQTEVHSKHSFSCICIYIVSSQSISYPWTTSPWPSLTFRTSRTHIQIHRVFWLTQPLMNPRSSAASRFCIIRSDGSISNRTAWFGRFVSGPVHSWAGSTSLLDPLSLVHTLPRTDCIPRTLWLDTLRRLYSWLWPRPLT